MQNNNSMKLFVEILRLKQISSNSPKGGKSDTVVKHHSSSMFVALGIRTHMAPGIRWLVSAMTRSHFGTFSGLFS